MVQPGKCRPLKVRLQEHRKAVVRGEIEKTGIADHIWKEKGNHLPLWNKVKIIDREGHWKRRRLKEAAHMLGHLDLLSRPSIEHNLGTNDWKDQIILFLKKITLKISRITDTIGFYILKSSHDASGETCWDASWIDWREKQWRHYLTSLYLLNALFDKQSNFKNYFPDWIISIPR